MRFRTVEMLQPRVNSHEFRQGLERLYALQLVKLPGLGLSEEDIPEVLGLEEFRAMLEERVKEWNKVLLERGRREGEATMLLRQLEVKFGDVDERIRKQIEAASSERLIQWAERLVTAEGLADVLPL